MRELLESKAIANQADSNGITPLHFAAVFGHKKMVRELLAHGAYVNKMDDNGCTPLDKALVWADPLR